MPRRARAGRPIRTHGKKKPNGRRCEDFHWRAACVCVSLSLAFFPFPLQREHASHTYYTLSPPLLTHTSREQCSFSCVFSAPWLQKFGWRRFRSCHGSHRKVAAIPRSRSLCAHACCVARPFLTRKLLSCAPLSIHFPRTPA